MVSAPHVGSRVQIVVAGHAGETTHEGVVLPSAAPDFVTLKLVNGYNISHPLSMIKSMQEISLEEKQINAPPKVIQSVELPKITIIHTGGTIASKVDYTTGAVVARFEPDELLASIPELIDIAFIESVKLGNMWSDDVRPQHWNMMCKSVQDAFDNGSVGVVITHGTDTLHISAAALSFAFAGNGGKPAGRIVFTGSQRSSDRASSDASENLISAVYWAAHGPDVNGEWDSAVTVMHAGSGDGVCAVNPGVSVRKMHSTRRDAFKTVNGQPLGEINLTKSGITHKSNIVASSRKISKPTMYDTDIRIAQFIAGPHLHSDLIETAIDSGYSAIIIHGTGLGHLPIENSMGDAPENDKLRSTIEKSSIPIIIGNQCINGPVDLNVYSKGRNQQDIGVLGHGSTSSPEALLAKIHWLLSTDDNLSRLEENLCGENDLSLIS
ncbi:MAG: Glu-tRNA(Gln) amidotransferase subunit GatD [Candidatus Poseidoniaceae archaeon]|jgi:glutamyl-tRNA(Gln) amidotransferase subunit D|nr:Glu-tRNA(Gln) amidotransferase subunit GatD [Candidatus Poseidoniaceae archaeon]